MNRGMKKWQPYASLPEFKIKYDQMMNDKKKKPRPQLSDDQIWEINRTLVSLNPGDMIDLTYYFNGFIYKLKSKLLAIDAFASRLLVNEGIIEFSDIVSLTSERCVENNQIF